MRKIMLGVIDLQAVQEKSTNRVALHLVLQQLIGQPFLQLRFSYGDELNLHFGQPREYPSPKMKHLIKGSYILGTRASNWQLRPSASPLLIIGSNEFQGDQPTNFKQMSKEEFETSGVIQPDSRIVSAVAFPIAAIPGAPASGFGLYLQLSDGSSFLIRPETAEPPGTPEMEVADWELFTPLERYLRVGPGLEWSYLPSRHSSTQSA